MLFSESFEKFLYTLATNLAFVQLQMTEVRLYLTFRIWFSD